METSIDEALARIPGWASAHYRWSVLAGGLTNRSFLIERGTDRFVLRLNAPYTDIFNLDRDTELKVLRVAAAEGLAPEAIYSNSEDGVLLSRYLPGTTWSPAHFQDAGNLERIAQLLTRVHALPLSGTLFSAKEAAQTYTNALGLQGPWLSIAKRCQDIIERNRSDAVPVCCHNDTVAENIIETPSLRLLDWEYAADNDAYFDLAVIVSHHQLGERETDILLSAYDGGVTAERKQRLRRQQRIYDTLLWLWLAARNVATNDETMLVQMAEVASRFGNES